MKNTTFMIVIKDDQNESWQGTIEWIEKGYQQNFRSALELVRLMDSAMTDTKTIGFSKEKKPNK